MRVRTLSLLALGFAAAACRAPEKKAPALPRPNWLLDVPYLAQSRLLDTTGTPDAQHIVIQSPAPIDSVASFYRHRLPPMGWMIMGDAHDSVHVTLYLLRRGAPMWIQIEAQGPESRVSFIAAGPGRRPPPPPQR
jgi:hypothetical protein